MNVSNRRGWHQPVPHQCKHGTSPPLNLFHSLSGVKVEKQYLFHGSVCFQHIFFCFFVSSKRLYDIHITWFDRFLCREGDRMKINDYSCFISAGQIVINKIKTSLRARGLRSLRILRIGRSDSATNKRVFNPQNAIFYQGTPLETRIGLGLG